MFQGIGHGTTGAVRLVLRNVDQLRMLHPGIRQFRRAVPAKDLPIIQTATAVYAVRSAVSSNRLTDFRPRLPGIHVYAQ